MRHTSSSRWQQLAVYPGPTREVKCMRQGTPSLDTLVALDMGIPHRPGTLGHHRRCTKPHQSLLLGLHDLEAEGRPRMRGEEGVLGGKRG